jgi:hypothetical protein
MNEITTLIKRLLQKQNPSNQMQYYGLTATWVPLYFRQLTRLLEYKQNTDLNFRPAHSEL